MEPWFNEPLFHEVIDMMNEVLRPVQSYSKMYGIKPWYNKPQYNKFFNITNTIQKPKHKIYLNVTNHNLNMQQKINAEQITVKTPFNPCGKKTATFLSMAYYML